MNYRNATWASWAVIVFVLALLAVMSGALYAIHNQQKAALEKAFVHNADSLLLGIEIQSGSLIASFDWPILEQLQQEAAMAPLVEHLWIEDFVSNRVFGEVHEKAGDDEHYFSRDIVVEGEIVGRAVAYISTSELAREQRNALHLLLLVFGASSLAVLSVVIVFVLMRERQAHKLLAAQASRIKAEQELTKSVGNFRVMVEDLGEGVLIHRNGLSFFANEAFLRIFSLTDIESLNKGEAFGFLPNLNEDGQLIVPGDDGDRVLAARAVEQVEIQHQGRTIWLEVRSFPMEWDGDAAVCSTLVDISARHQTEVLLKQAQADAELANNAKSVFLSSMSHELRTPLNAILGFSQLLALDPEVPLTEGQRECVDQISRGGEHLLELLNDVLDLAKIEAGKVEVSIEDISPLEVLDECLPMISVLATQHGVSISTPKVTNVQMVRADHTRFKQVLINLLSNAVKYNRENGTVTVTFETLAGGKLRVAVIDTGAGISEERQKELFQPFSRLGAEQSEIEGSGVGLVICKKLVELMGCSLGFASKVGEGSRFWVDLPLAVSSHEELVAHTESEMVRAAGSLDDIRGTLLYVEDNRSSLRLMELIVSRIEGVSMLSARDAETGMALARAEKPDVIILDINLPGSDGYDLLRNLHHFPETKDIPVLALSAAASKQDVEKGLKAGFVRYLTKPVEVNEVVNALRAVLVRD